MSHTWHTVQQSDERQLKGELESAALERQRLSEAIALKSEDLARQQEMKKNLEAELQGQRELEASARKQLAQLEEEKARLEKLVCVCVCVCVCFLACSHVCQCGRLSSTILWFSAYPVWGVL